MSEEFEKDEYLVPVSLATGSFDSHEAFLLLAYYGFGVITDKKSKAQYLTLSTSIEFNQRELKSSSGSEKLFREEILKELESISSYETAFNYSEKILSLWAKAFPNQAKELLKSKSKKIDPSIRDIVKDSVD